MLCSWLDVGTFQITFLSHKVFTTSKENTNVEEEWLLVLLLLNLIFSMLYLSRAACSYHVLIKKK